MNILFPDFSSEKRGTSAQKSDNNSPRRSQNLGTTLDTAFTKRLLAPVRASAIAPGLRELRLWELPQGAVGRCELNAGDRFTLTGVEGQCWVTQQGDRHDYLLVPGKNLTFNGPGRLVFEAVADSATLAVS